MELVHHHDPKLLIASFWAVSIMSVILGIANIYSAYTNGIDSLSQGVGIVVSLFFMLLGILFIANQLHYKLVWEPRENKYGKMALESAMTEIPKIIFSLGHDNWKVTSPNEFGIRLEYIISGNKLADFKLHTHTITASYADSGYKLWFEGYYINKKIEGMIYQIVEKLSEHFNHEYDISGLKLNG